MDGNKKCIWCRGDARKARKKKPNQIFSTTLKLQDSENPLGFYFLPVYPVPLRASTTYIWVYGLFLYFHVRLFHINGSLLSSYWFFIFILLGVSVVSCFLDLVISKHLLFEYFVFSSTINIIQYNIDSSVCQYEKTLGSTEIRACKQPFYQIPCSDNQLQRWLLP